MPFLDIKKKKEELDTKKTDDGSPQPLSEQKSVIAPPIATQPIVQAVPSLVSQSEQKKSDVPDELPPLEKKPDIFVATTKESGSKSNSLVPDELPTLSIPKEEHHELPVIHMPEEQKSFLNAEQKKENGKEQDRKEQVIILEKPEIIIHEESLFKEELKEIKIECAPEIPVQKTVIVPAPQIKPAVVTVTMAQLRQDESFFGDLMKKLRNESYNEEAKKLLDGNIVQEMKKHFEKEKKQGEIRVIEQEIQEKLVPLQKLEQEWQYYNTDITQKQKILKDKESDIESRTIDIKKTIGHYNELKKDFELFKKNN